MANSKVEICLKKKTHPEHKYFVTFVTKFGTKGSVLVAESAYNSQNAQFGLVILHFLPICTKIEKDVELI